MKKVQQALLGVACVALLALVAPFHAAAAEAAQYEIKMSGAT